MTGRFNTLPLAYKWIQKELESKRVKASEIVEMTLRYGDKGTIRRMGILLELQRTKGNLLRRLERSLTPSSSFIPWIPTKPKRGKISRKWGVVINE